MKNTGGLDQVRTLHRSRVQISCSCLGFLLLSPTIPAFISIGWMFLALKSFTRNLKTLRPLTLIPPHKLPLSSLQCGHLLQSLTNSNSHFSGRQLHAHIISSGLLLHNTYLSTKLAAMYAIHGHLPEARTIFDTIISKNSFLWNIMVRGYACNGLPLHAILLYRQMVASGTRPDNFTYPFVLMACGDGHGDSALIETGKKIHGEIMVSGYASDVFVCNALLSMYSKFGDMGVARMVFDKMHVRDLISRNIVISGYARNSQPERALFEFSVVAKSGYKPDRATFLGVLPACADLSALKQGKEIHACMIRCCVRLDEFMVNALIDVYAKSSFIAGARRLFGKMSRRDVVSWNSMITGCARHGDAVECLKLFYLMKLEGLVPDEVTIVAVLGVCGRIAALSLGTSLHATLIRNGHGEGVAIGTALVDMYAKCGSLIFSRQAFDEILTKNLVCWSAMVSGYGLHGMGREAFACFSEMKAKHIIPDKITFTSLLSACSHAGLVCEGKEIFDQMSNDYGIKPSVEHYSCIVDLLGRAGHLDEAYNLIMNMEVEPSVDIWAALVSACRVHRNIELAEIAAQKAFDLQPKCVGVYVSLSNIYALEKRWRDVERVRVAARRHGFKKTPGCSFVELDMRIHRFIVGDKSHPQSKSIYAKLDELRKQLKESGYTPNTSSVFYDVEENVKEDMLWDHSERLAIAFALLNTCPGSSIRITKNLRVCNDCHTVTKLISKMVDREIIVRDAHRFHHFRNGSCSCGGYW